MKQSVVLLFSAVFVLVAVPAEAKYMNTKITLKGPGLDPSIVIAERRVMDTISIALLDGTRRTRVEKPVVPGPGYSLRYRIGIGDEDGSRNDVINQVLYPYAKGGPVVHTNRGEVLEMSYGPVRFTPGWFAASRRVMQIFRARGLPTEEPSITTSAATKQASSNNKSGGALTPLFAIAAVTFLAALTLLVPRLRTGRDSRDKHRVSLGDDLRNQHLAQR